MARTKCVRRTRQTRKKDRCETKTRARQKPQQKKRWNVELQREKKTQKHDLDVESPGFWYYRAITIK